MVDFGNDWNDVLRGEFDKEYYRILRGFLKHEYETEIIYPNMYDIFNAFKATAYKDVKVVIIGQDPYVRPNQAHGMCFSVKTQVAIPPSLKNIFKEINADLGIPIPTKGNLLSWANQGVLLLNTILTVRAGTPLSHKGYGWEQFTDNVLMKLNERDKPIIFLLWGEPAKKKARLITSARHIILQASHPSPLGAYHGFFGCKHFSKVNNILESMKMSGIDWRIN
ncbi:MAG TPA: uracil-DNA glycosylase [Clostridia bacterium]|nr:uracil-DNA glycosylase [Clostridia bacterium]